MVRVDTLTMGIQIMTDEEFQACNAMDQLQRSVEVLGHSLQIKVQDGYITQTVNHPEEGHWEWR